MSQPNENKVSLKLFGDAPISTVGDQLQLQPTRTAHKGEPRRNLAGEPFHAFEYNFWEYQCILKENRFLGEHAEEFISKIIEPRVEQLEKLLQTLQGELSVVQYYYDGFNPGFHLSNQSLRLLAKTGLEFDVDIYCFEEDESNCAQQSVPADA